jgi:hypothetical protein
VRLIRFFAFLSLVFLFQHSLSSAAAEPPASWSDDTVRASMKIETLDYPSLDVEKLAFEDDLNEALGKPPRFAVPRAISRSPIRDGEWFETSNGVSVWKLRVSADDAVNLNFGFRDVYLPEGARLYIYSAEAEKNAIMDRFEVLGPFGPEINEDHRQFWTPLLETDEAVIEINVPTRLRDRVSLELTQVSQGYRGFGQAALGYRQSNFGIGEGKSTECEGKMGEGGARSGSCNMDVACLAPDDPWNDPRRSVGAMFVSGTSTCTGSLVNNTANDRRMLFMTATHCGLTASSAPSLVVYWNYEWPTCRTPGDPEGTQVNPPDPSQTNSGASFLAATENPFSGCSTPGNCSDVTLLELDDPADPTFDLFWSGWDRRTTSDATTCGPQGAPGSTDGLCASIHHPGVDEKRITFVEQDYFVDNIAGAQNVHWRARWHTDPPVVDGIPDPQPASIPPGVTEPGSSGSPLYTADQRFIGVLSGGPAFCGATGTSLSDLYGQLAHAWDGLGTPTTRMRDYLDPLNTSAEFIDGIGSSPFRLAAMPAAVSACTTEGSVDIVIDVEADDGFNENVTLAVSGVPAGASDSLSVNPVTPPGTSTLTLGSLGSVTAGTYLVGVQGTAPGEDPLDLAIPLELTSLAPPVTTLVAPADGALNVSSTPVFSWSDSAQASTYLLEIASDPGFSNVLVSEPVSGSNTSFEPSTPLPTSTQLYWRVTPSNQCGTADASAVFSFTTASAPGDCGPGTAPQLYFADDMEGGVNGWTTAAGSGFVIDTWAQDGTDGNSGSNSWRGLDVDEESDQQLISPPIVVPSGVSPLTLQYSGKRDIEDGGSGCFDGGVLEYSTDGGSNWIPVADNRLETNPYTGPLDDRYNNPLAGRDAWCGSQDWTRTVVDLTGLDGETLQFRFRLATDESVAADDWHIDDVRVQSCVVVQEEIFADGFETPPVTR